MLIIPPNVLHQVEATNYSTPSGHAQVAASFWSALALNFRKNWLVFLAIRNFDALNDIENLRFSGEVITKHGLHHQIVITLMDLPPDCKSDVHTAEYYLEKLKEILEIRYSF